MLSPTGVAFCLRVLCQEHWEAPLGSFRSHKRSNSGSCGPRVSQCGASRMKGKALQMPPLATCVTLDAHCSTLPLSLLTCGQVSGPTLSCSCLRAGALLGAVCKETASGLAGRIRVKSKVRARGRKKGEEGLAGSLALIARGHGVEGGGESHVWPLS